VKIFKLNLSEISFLFPVILTASLGCLASFWLILELTGSNIKALFAALVVAILPIHVITSRNLSGGWTVAYLLQTLSLVYLVKYGKKQSNKNALAAGCIIGVYLWSHTIFSFFLPVLFLLPLFKSDISGIVNKYKYYLNPYLLLPPLLSFSAIALIYFLGKIVGGENAMLGEIGHIVARNQNPQMGFGNYSSSAFYGLLHNTGAFLFALVILSFFLVIYSSFKERLFFKSERIIFVWGFFFFLPFLIKVNPKEGHTLGYLLHASASFSIYAVIVFWDIISAFNKKALNYIFLSSIIIVTLLSTVSTTFSDVYPSLQIDYAPTWLGSAIKSDFSLKSAGYYFRKNTEKGEVVFSFLCNPYQSSYYYNRCVISTRPPSASSTALLILFTYIDNVSYVILPSDHKYLDDVRKKFKIVANIKLSDSVPLLILKKRELCGAKDLEVKFYNGEALTKRFDNTYNKLEDFLGLPFNSFYWTDELKQIKLCGTF